MEKKISKNQKMYPHRFGYSQNGGGTFSDFLIFFSPWLYLLITTSSSLKKTFLGFSLNIFDDKKISMSMSIIEDFGRI